MNKTVWFFIASALGYLLKQASPEIRAMLADFIGKLRERAAKTPNPVDDVLVDGLAALLSLE